MTTLIKAGQIVHDRKRPMPKSVAIVVGPGRVDGQLRISCWRGGRLPWKKPVVIGHEQLIAVVDWTELSLTEAKRLASAAFERNYLVCALEMAQGSITKAARAAGVDRSNFRRLLQRHGLVKIASPLKRRKK